MNVFSFRAECQLDVDRLRELLPRGSELKVVPYDLAPDVKVEMTTGMSMGEVSQLMAALPDGHVMLETLREGPLSENSLERERMRG